MLKGNRKLHRDVSERRDVSELKGKTKYKADWLWQRRDNTHNRGRAFPMFHSNRGDLIKSELTQEVHCQSIQAALRNAKGEKHEVQSCGRNMKTELWRRN